MRMFALVFACLACVGHGLKAQDTAKDEQTPNSVNALANLLMASSPSAGWQLNGAGLGRSMARSTGARAAPTSMGVADLPGISTETGNVVWDPLGLSDKMDEENLNLIRAAELKHGRVAMLAVVGWLWTATGTHFNGMISVSKGISFADCAAAANPIEAAAKVPGGGIGQIIAAIGAVELYWENKYPAYKCAGNFGVPAVTQDPEKLKELQTVELKHGRLAMIGIISFAVATAIPGSVPFYPF